MSDYESPVLVYAVPFAAAMLVAVGLAGTVLGGWAAIQPAIGACENPMIAVSTPAETHQRFGDPGSPSVDRLEFEELTPAEQAAFESAIENPHRDAAIVGETAHIDEFERGVVISAADADRYAILTSYNRCLSVDPLVLPLGGMSLLLGLTAFAYLWFRFT